MISISQSEEIITKYEDYSVKSCSLIAALFDALDGVIIEPKGASVG